MGLDVRTAIRLFLRSVVETGTLPMPIALPNPATRAAIQVAKEGKTEETTLADL